jgi:hypothetical protein
MNRENFVTLNRTRLFTADQVVDIAQAEREKVLEQVRTERIRDESAGYPIFRILEELRKQEQG